MKGISNYIAALITVAMIFTTIAFFVATSVKQARINTQALNTMVEISDRARENLAVSSIFKGGKIIMTIANKGTIDTSLEYLLIVSKTLETYTISLNGTIVPVGGIVNVKLDLPVPSSNVFSIKITTGRGNVFDVLSSANKPVSLQVLVDPRSIDVNGEINVSVIIVNNIPSTLVIRPEYVNVSFIMNGEDVSGYFAVKNVFPTDTVLLRPGEEMVLTFTYEYGGLPTPCSGCPVDIYVLLHSTTELGGEVYASIYDRYSFIVLR